MALERELDTYRAKLPDLLAHAGQFVVIHGDEVAGVYPGFDEALRDAYARFGEAPFLVRKISESEPVLTFTRNLTPCRSSPKT